MMLRFFSSGRSWLVGLALCTAASAFAEISTEAAEVLMRKDGLWEQLDQIPAAIGAEVKRRTAKGSGATLAEDAANAIADAFLQTFSAERMQVATRAVIARDLPREQLSPLLEWFDSPLGREIQQAQVASDSRTASKGFEVAIKDGSAAFAKAPPRRQALLQRVERAVDAGGAAARFVLGSGMAAAQAMATAGNDPQSVEQARQELESARPQLENQYRLINTVLSVSVYENLTDDELTRYVEFLESPAGRQFQAVAIRGVEEAFRDAGAAAGRELAKRLPARQAPAQ